jgi:hypothetical protein
MGRVGVPWSARLGRPHSQARQSGGSVRRRLHRGPAAKQPSRSADDPPAQVGETLTGSDPLVPGGTGADPIVIVPPGYDLAS